MKKQQSGCVYEQSGSWCCRWRETVRTPEGGTARKMRFKLLREITPEDRRNKDRGTGKLRIPSDVQAAADDITGAVNQRPEVPALLTIGEFVTDYLKVRKRDLKPSVHSEYSRLWKKHLEIRIAQHVLRDFGIVEANALWRAIHRAAPNLSRQTINHMRFFVAGVFRDAINAGLYPSRPYSLPFVVGARGKKFVFVGDLPRGLRGRGKTKVYTLDEVLRLLTLFTNQPKSQAILSFAWASSARKSEISAVRWEDYERNDSGAVVHIKQSNVRGLISTPKTEASAGDAYLGEGACAFIDAYWESIGKPTTGYMFGHPKTARRPEAPLNMDSFVKWAILPMLERCVTCGKHPSIHGNEDHELQRNPTVPEWKGWHGFRRGNATFLAKNSKGDGLREASLMLRHADEGVTENHYVKISGQQKRALKARKVVQITEQRLKAAQTIDAGLKQQQVN